MHRLSFSSACSTFLLTSPRCLLSSSMSASRLERLFLLLFYSSLRFLSFYSQISRVDLCRSIFLSYSRSSSTWRAICSCTPRYSQFLRLNSSLALFDFSWLCLAFSSISFSSSAFSKAFLSQKEDFSSRVPSRAESYLMFDYNCARSYRLSCSYSLVDAISSFRPFTISRQLLNSSKNRSNSSSSLYFRSNSPWRVSYFCCRSSTFPSQCSFSFLSSMILLLSSASTIEYLSSVMDLDLLWVYGSLFLEFRIANFSFSLSRSRHCSHSSCASVQNCPMSLDRYFSYRFLSFLWRWPISLRLLMISMRDLSPRNYLSLKILSLSTCSPKMIELKVQRQKTRPLPSQRNLLRSLQLSSSLQLLPQSKCVIRSLFVSACQLDVILALNSLKICNFSFNLAYQLSLFFSICRIFLDYSLCWLVSCSFLSISLVSLASLALPSSLSCPRSSCSRYLVILAMSSPSLRSPALPAVLFLMHYEQLSERSLSSSRLVSTLRSQPPIHCSSSPTMLWLSKFTLCSRCGEASFCPEAGSLALCGVLSPCPRADSFCAALLRSSSNLLSASLSMNISSCGQTLAAIMHCPASRSSSSTSEGTSILTKATQLSAARKGLPMRESTARAGRAERGRISSMDLRSLQARCSTRRAWLCLSSCEMEWMQLQERKSSSSLASVLVASSLLIWLNSRLRMRRWWRWARFSMRAIMLLARLSSRRWEKRCRESMRWIFSFFEERRSRLCVSDGSCRQSCSIVII